MQARANNTSLMTSMETDLKNIRAFFLDEQRFKQALVALDQQLALHMKTCLDALSSAGKPVDLGPDKNKGYRILSSFFKAWAKENGFNYSVMSGFLPAGEFARVLIGKNLFRDTAFGDSIHGGWGHFVQWVSFVEEHKRRAFLINSPVSILVDLGLSEEGDQGSPWFDTFEFNKDVIDPSTFMYKPVLGAGVLQLSTFLISEEGGQLVPTLSMLIRKCFSKRNMRDLEFEGQLLEDLQTIYVVDETSRRKIYNEIITNHFNQAIIDKSEYKQYAIIDYFKGKETESISSQFFEPAKSLIIKNLIKPDPFKYHIDTNNFFKTNHISDDLIKIMLFLMSETRLTARLTRFASELEDYLASNQKSLSGSFESFIEAWLVKNKFSDYRYGEIIKSLLDSLVPTITKQYTKPKQYAILWWCIVEENKEKPFLRNTISFIVEEFFRQSLSNENQTGMVRVGRRI